MKRGETGAVNSANHSEVLVHRRTGKRVSKSRHINARSAAHRSKHQTSAVDLLQGSCLGRLCIRARKSPMTDINARLHAWSTRFHLGLVLSQITCLTAGSHEPRASQRVTTWSECTHSLTHSLSRLRPSPLRKVDSPCMTMQRLAVAPATLTAVSALAFFPAMSK